MVEVKKTKNHTIPKKTIYCKIIGKKRMMLPPEHPMFCCEYFQGCILNDLRIAITYDPAYRLYYYITPKQETSTHIISRCSYCGKKWPKHLANKFFKELGKVMGHEIVYIEFDWSTLPEEFKSEEWWRKRGL